jgi:hypothetical protein
MAIAGGRGGIVFARAPVALVRRRAVSMRGF